MAGLEKVTGSFIDGVEEASQILNVKGKVLPVTGHSIDLYLKLNDGSILKGENQINHSDFESIGVSELYVTEDMEINPHAKYSIENADYIIIGPGNHYCSVLPALSIKGIKEAFYNTKAKIIYISNLTNKKGHSMHFDLSNYVKEIEKHIAKSLDIIIYNNEPPTDEQIKYYELQEGDGVIIKNDMTGDIRVREYNLLSHKINTFDKNDKVAAVRSFIRHDSNKIKNTIDSIINTQN